MILRPAALQSASLAPLNFVIVADAHHGWYVKPANGQPTFYETMKKHESRIIGLFHGHFHNTLRGWDDHKPVHGVLFPSALYNQDRTLEEQKAPGLHAWLKGRKTPEEKTGGKMRRIPVPCWIARNGVSRTRKKGAERASARDSSPRHTKNLEQRTISPFPFPNHAIQSRLLLCLFP